MLPYGVRCTLFALGCDLAHTAKAAVDSFNVVVFVRLFGAMATQVVFQRVDVYRSSYIDAENKRCGTRRKKEGEEGWNSLTQQAGAGILFS
jgi:hypothetical protein